MPQELKVKDYSNIYWLIVPLCCLPLVFIIIGQLLSENYLAAFIIVLIIYSIYFTLFIRNLIKNEKVYAIEANEEDVTFYNYGTFKWNEVAKIESFTKIKYYGSRRYEERYLDIKLNVKPYHIVLAVSSFDYDYIELAEKLQRLGKLA